jgi:hypothetical protein
MSLGQVVFGAKVTAPAARGSQTSQEVRLNTGRKGNYFSTNFEG